MRVSSVMRAGVVLRHVQVGADEDALAGDLAGGDQIGEADDVHDETRGVDDKVTWLQTANAKFESAAGLTSRHQPSRSGRNTARPAEQRSEHARPPQVIQRSRRHGGQPGVLPGGDQMSPGSSRSRARPPRQVPPAARPSGRACSQAGIVTSRSGNRKKQRVTNVTTARPRMSARRRASPRSMSRLPLSALRRHARPVRSSGRQPRPRRWRRRCSA